MKARSHIFHIRFLFGLQEDPKPIIEAHCADTHCSTLKQLLEACTARVEINPRSGETCTQELFEFAHCVDHCVRLLVLYWASSYISPQAAPKLFANLR